MMNNESGIVNAPYVNADTFKVVLNERTTDGKTEYKCCHCHEWKVWKKMSHNVLLTYPAQYECLDYIKARANSKLDLTIHTIIKIKILMQTRLFWDIKDLLIVIEV